MEFAASVNSVKDDLKLEGRLFLPSKVNRARAVVVIIDWGGINLNPLPEWRKLSETLQSGLLYARMNRLEIGLNNRYGEESGSADRGGADGLLVLLERFAQESGHRELATVPLLFWGGRGVGQTFAALHPQRTIAFVVVHSTMRNRDIGRSSQIPALFLSGNEPHSELTQEFWKSGRATGTPWTFALQSDTADNREANKFISSWITAVSSAFASR